MTDSAENENAVTQASFPYAVEYAKTGRSRCRKCKSLIGEGCVRFSAREPSRFFDGMQDNWHHFHCFWTALKKGSINERSIGGLEFLKWDDQEKIRAVIVEHKPSGTRHNLREVQLQCTSLDYARTNRSKCVECKEVIKLGTLRCSTNGRFFHTQCFWNREDVIFIGSTPDDLTGLSLLLPADKSEIEDAFWSATRKSANHSSKDSGETDSKKPKLENISDEEQYWRDFKQQTEYMWELRSGFNKMTAAQLEVLIQANFLDTKAAKANNMENLCDAALFGRTSRCVRCTSGSYLYSPLEQQYVCDGYISSFTKCSEKTSTPFRIPFIVPSPLAIQVPWLVDSAPVNKMTRRIFKKNEEIVRASRSFRHLGAGRNYIDDLERGYKNNSTFLMKRGTAVDGAFPYVEVAHVYVDDDGLFSAALSCVDMTLGVNSYYKIQLLEHDSLKKYWVFRSWGRIGTLQGGDKTEAFKSLDAAKEKFQQVFLEKTANEWKYRKHFLKKASFMNYIETDDIQTQLSAGIAPGSLTKLSKPLVDLINLIFNEKSMNEALRQYSIDTAKMPLGKLSRTQILKAYSVLQELQDLIVSNAIEGFADRVLDASNRFYTYIPHTTELVHLNTIKHIQNKSRMLDSLLEICEAYSVLSANNGNSKNELRDPIDLQYESLKASIVPLDKDSEEYERIANYARKTHGVTHNHVKVDIVEIFKVDRIGEETKFKKEIGNRKLLWHGSLTPNFTGILAQGLRIAPPEAPSSGYMFGKGVYFADMFSKSANYCRANSTDGLLLLADVALGQIQQEYHSKSYTLQQLKTMGKHSVMGVGLTVPSSSTYIEHSDGYTIPVGSPTTTEVSKNGPSNKHRKSCPAEIFSLVYNEYIVYDVDQIRLRYLIRCRFSYADL